MASARTGPANLWGIGTACSFDAKELDSSLDQVTLLNDAELLAGVVTSTSATGFAIRVPARSLSPLHQGSLVHSLS